MPEFILQQDTQWNEWRLARAGADWAESIFDNIEEAIRHLPEAVGPEGGLVRIFDGDREEECIIRPQV